MRWFKKRPNKTPHIAVTARYDAPAWEFTIPPDRVKCAVETQDVWDSMGDVFTVEDFARWRAEALAKAEADEKRG